MIVYYSILKHVIVCYDILQPYAGCRPAAAGFPKLDL